MSAELAIEARDLRKVYAAPGGEVVALEGLDLACRRGEVFGLLGANGAGKTTTLRILATLLAPTSGSARVAGFDVEREPLAVRRALGFLSASTGLYPRLTARETLEYFGRLHGLEGGVLRARVEELLAAFDLRELQRARCEALSTGQRQRVGLARAMLHAPPVLILDEPTTGLDVLAAGATIDFVEQQRRAGACVLLSTHVLAEAERLCDRIGVIHGGRLAACGTLDELRAQTGAHWLEDVFRALIGAPRQGTEAA